MAGLEDQLTELGVTFALVLARVGGLVATAPLLSDTSIPLRVKALLAVALSALTTPVVMATGIDSPPGVATMIELGAIALWEIVIGIALGLGLAVVLAGVQLTGQIVGQMSGMALAEGSDPIFGDTASVFGQVFYLATAAVFVTAGGHTAMVNGLLDTFEHAPPGSGFTVDELAYGFLGLLSLGFELGVRASAPLLIALFLATLVLGLVSRTLPQINTIAIGFGINSLLTLGMMAASIGTIAYVFQGPLSSVIDGVVASVGDANSPASDQQTSPSPVGEGNLGPASRIATLAPPPRG
ncbi:MAG: flagellar biosynthetic protein FliR [Planctomycetota bacterium]